MSQETYPCSACCSAEPGEQGRLPHLPSRLGSKGTAMSPWRDAPLPAAWAKRACQPRRSRCGFILPLQCNKLLRGREEQTQALRNC